MADEFTAAIGGTASGVAADAHDQGADADRVLSLAAESMVVSRRVRRTAVRATVATERHEETVDETLTRRHVDIRRVPVDRVVDVAPPTREEDGVLIIPVVAEKLVVERRLVLVEEVHIRQRTTADRHVETVALRRETVVVERRDLGIGPVEPDAAATTIKPKDHR